MIDSQNSSTELVYNCSFDIHSEFLLNSGFIAYNLTGTALCTYADSCFNCLVIAGMFQHNAKYYEFLCGWCTEYCLKHWTNNVERELPHLQMPSLSSAAKRRDTVTAMNEFSMDRAPMARRVTNIVNKSALKVVLEEEIMKAPNYRNDTKQFPEKMISSLSNDFMVEDLTNDHSKSSMNFDFGIYLEYWRPDRKNYVKPKYQSLKEELTKNRHQKLSEQQFDELREICEQYLVLDFKANFIGRGNEICYIAAGSAITIAHLMAMKIYTDFDDTQREFKRHCRRIYKGESVESVMERNREIANWCRLMRECIMFWGKTMKKKDVFYCGLTARLLLNSEHHRFECPLSTTKSFDVAQQFTDGFTGTILMLKRGNGKTRYFDCSRISAFPNEEERLFMGSTLKIKGILIYDGDTKKWEHLKPKGFVSALAMFEAIYNGHFIDGNDATRTLLLSLLQAEIDRSGHKGVFQFDIVSQVRFEGKS